MKSERRDLAGDADGGAGDGKGSTDVKGDAGWEGAGGKGSIVQPVSMANRLAATQPLMIPWRIKTGFAIMPASGGE